MSDLSTMVMKETGTFNLLHPVTKTELDSKITVFGSHSKKFNAAEYRIKNRMLKKRSTVRTAEQMEEDKINLLAECTESWENIEWQGKPLECNFENAKMLYTKVSWIRDQVDFSIMDNSLFLE